MIPRTIIFEEPDWFRESEKSDKIIPVAGDYLFVNWEGPNKEKILSLLKEKYNLKTKSDSWYGLRESQLIQL